MTSIVSIQRARDLKTNRSAEAGSLVHGSDFLEDPERRVKHRVLMSRGRVREGRRGSTERPSLVLARATLGCVGHESAWQRFAQRECSTDLCQRWLPLVLRLIVFIAVVFQAFPSQFFHSDESEHPDIH